MPVTVRLAAWRCLRNFEIDENSRSHLKGKELSSGADIKAIASGEIERANPLHQPSDDALDRGVGATRFGVEGGARRHSGYCVAGGPSSRLV